LHLPPHPSDDPHAAPAGQTGVHTQWSVGLQLIPVGHVPPQRPPQPSEPPHIPIDGPVGEQSG
jgi:hypothetical protein